MLKRNNPAEIARDAVGSIDDGPPRVSPARVAWGDIGVGFSQNWMWIELALQDIRQRYRGSILGPFWLTLSMAIMVGAMGVIYSRLFGAQADAYLPYLMLGLIIWQFFSSLAIDGCQTFLAAEQIIQQVSMPYTVHAYRVVFRNLIVLAHNAVIIPAGILIFRIPIGWSVLQTIPALLLVAIDGVWICLLCGMVSARFRDIPPIVTSVVQVVFFVTPIIWPVDTLGGSRFIVDINPVFAAVDVIRAPLLGVAVSPYSWPLLVTTTAVGSIGTFAFFARFRARIAYWV